MDKKILHRFFMGTASFEEEKAVCNWAEASTLNKEELIKERKYFDMILMHPTKEKMDTINVKRISLHTFASDFLKIAAAIVLIISASFYIFNINSHKEELGAMNKIEVPPGQRVNITLSDGTNVWLNACSELVYPNSFGKGDSRNVKLKGEAYFDVTKDKRHPFIVETSQYDIKVLGTKFNVKSDCLDDIFSTALLEGSVEICERKATHNKILLSPMQMVQLQAGKMVIDSITNTDNFLWTKGLVCFDNIEFPKLMKRFENIYDIQIVISSTRLQKYKCSGKCRVSDGIDFILQVLQRNANFTFKRNEDNTVIYIN